MRQIPLTHGRVALVDDEDYERIAAHTWRAQRGKRTWYALRTVQRADGTRTAEMMHRVILGAVAGVEVDHRDGDGLNNCRANLRFATRSQNACNTPLRRDNTTGARGVYRRGNRWRAIITVAAERFHLGYFATREEAAAAYRAASEHLHGEFRRSA